jgi:hypothetical protein
VVGHDAAGHADVRERGVLARQQRARLPLLAALLAAPVARPRRVVAALLAAALILLRLVGVIASGGGVQPAEHTPASQHVSRGERRHRGQAAQGAPTTVEAPLMTPS